MSFEERPSLFFQHMREIRRDYDKFKYDVTTKIIKNDINYAILKTLNLIVDIHGHSGTGKSEDGQALALYWQKRNKLLLNREVEIFLTFSRWQTIDAINKAKDGDIILQDEDTRLSGHGSSTAIDQMNNLIDIIRETQISFIFVSPHEKATLSQVNFFVETCLKDLKNRRNLVKVYNSKNILEGHAILNLHKDQLFRKNYLEKKRANIERLKQKRGRDSVHIRDEQLEEDYKLVKETSIEKGISLNNKSSIELCAKLAGVSGHTDYFKTLVMYIEKTKIDQGFFNVEIGRQQLQRQSYENPSLDPLNNFENSFISYRPKWKTSISDWFDYNLRGMKQKQIANKRGLKSHSSVSGNLDYFENQIKPEVKGSRKGIGLFWETAVFHTIVRIIQEKFPKYDYKIKKTGNKETIFENLEDNLPIRNTEDPGWEDETFTFEGHPLLAFAWLGGAKRVDFELTIEKELFPLEAKCALFSDKHSYSQDKLKPLLEHPAKKDKKHIISYSPSYGDKASKGRTAKGFTIKKGDKNIQEWVGDILKELVRGA